MWKTACCLEKRDGNWTTVLTEGPLNHEQTHHFKICTHNQYGLRSKRYSQSTWQSIHHHNCHVRLHVFIIIPNAHKIYVRIFKSWHACTRTWREYLREAHQGVAFQKNEEKNVSWIEKWMTPNAGERRPYRNAAYKWVKWRQVPTTDFIWIYNVDVGIFLAFVWSRKLHVRVLFITFGLHFICASVINF